jgi:hypothetical protein
MAEIIYPTKVTILPIIGEPETVWAITGDGNQCENGIRITVHGGTLFFPEGTYPLDLVENYSTYKIVELDLGPLNPQEDEVLRRVSYSFQKTTASEPHQNL